MSLATRCPTCGTVFRVVHDQLLVSQGWVRCGRCSGVFNATDDLLDMDTGLPVHLPGMATPPAAAPHPEPAAPTAPAQASPAAAQGAAPPPALPAAPETEPEPWAPPEPLAPLEALAPDTGAEAPAPGLLLRAPSAEAVPADLPDPAADTAPPPPGGLSATLADPTQATAPALAAMAAFPQEAPPPAEPAPEFVRVAERQAAWKRPHRRAAAAAGALVLGGLALAQAGLLWRDTLAAHHPGLAPTLQTLCRVTGCQLQPLRRIGQLSVDASALSRLDGVAADDPGAAQYRLNLTLRNRAEIALAAPAVELSLTDATGRLVQRRVLRLADLGAPQTALAPGQELVLQALLATGGQSVDGYTVELFYP
ncbi:zinc-ribbon and DUF3426 domain-containing protein [Ideonella sp. DXS22W]|uniref:Zinc-ribbon and DUF3426 domain-containing protein n=1 Tax=Pseudaquabacterium inlustre TaxID=2984192 RepID=A0ABU9CGT0_9BURK